MKQTCPVCEKTYKTELVKYPSDSRPIQQIFPNAKPYQREQLISGICSDKCWDKLTRRYE